MTLRVIRPIFAATHNATGPFPIFRMEMFGAVAGILASLLLKERARGEVLVATDLEAAFELAASDQTMLAAGRHWRERHSSAETEKLAGT